MQIARFLRAPGKPVILAMCRPDPKKNVLGLLRAYGQSRVLRELANLVLILVSVRECDTSVRDVTQV
jgi:sucrose-phosphate synthase